MSAKSLLSCAYEVLDESKEPLAFKELFTRALEKCELTLDESQLRNKMASLYTQLSIDGRFAQLEGGVWDLCSRHKFDAVHTKIDDDDDDEVDEEDDEEEKELLKAELGEEDDSSDEADNDDIDYDKIKKENDDEGY